MDASGPVALWAAVIVTLAVEWSAAGAAPAAPFVVQAGERQLFLDDVGIGSIEGLARTMHQPEKKGAVIRPDPVLGETVIQSRTAPVWDPVKSVYKFWSLYGPPELSYTGGYYESKDGLHWYRPALGFYEYRGSRDNSYVGVPLPDGRTVAPGHVVYDASDPDSTRRFKCFLPAEGVAVSPDGIAWRKLDVPGVPSGDEANFSFDSKRHLFMAIVKCDGPYGRAMCVSTSSDFEHWTMPELIFHADELDQELGRKNIAGRLADPTLEPPYWKPDPAVYNVDVYNMGVFGYEGLFIGMPAMYHAVSPVENYPNTDGFHLVQLACSRDLHTWQRLGDRQPFIGPSCRNSGAYDLTQILPPSAPVVRGDELWFYYWGGKYRGTFRWIGKYPDGEMVPLPGRNHDVGAVCLAVLRRDGFISLDAGEREGTLATRPFAMPQGRLYVNADGEAIRVEVLDESGGVMSRSQALAGDLPHQPVQWERGDVTAATGKTVSLRFALRKARLYSYWYE